MKPEKAFWDWFVCHEPKLFSFRAHRDDERESVFDELAAQLQRVHPDLAFEFGPNEARREFVISAGGIKGAFSSVSSLVGSAPILDRWRITAFRPRRNPENAVEFRGKRVDPRDVQFALLSNEKMPGVRLFIPGYQENDSDLKTVTAFIRTYTRFQISDDRKDCTVLIVARLMMAFSFWKPCTVSQFIAKEKA